MGTAPAQGQARWGSARTLRHTEAKCHGGLSPVPPVFGGSLRAAAPAAPLGAGADTGSCSWMISVHWELPLHQGLELAGPGLAKLSQGTSPGTITRLGSPRERCWKRGDEENAAVHRVTRVQVTRREGDSSRDRVIEPASPHLQQQLPSANPSPAHGSGRVPSVPVPPAQPLRLSPASPAPRARRPG